MMWSLWSFPQLVEIWRLYRARHSAGGCEPGRFAIPTKGNWNGEAWLIGNSPFPLDEDETRVMIFETQCMYTHLNEVMWAVWN
jgi:hypothetical protein